MRFHVYFVISILAFAIIGTSCTKPAGSGKGPGSDKAPGGDSSTLTTGNQPDSASRAGDAANPGATPPPDASQITSTTGGLPENWPADIPVMEGFEIKIGSVNPQGWKSALAVGTVPADEVMNFYGVLKGWQKDPNVPWISKGPHRTMKMIRGKENLLININERESRTELTLTYFSS